MDSNGQLFHIGDIDLNKGPEKGSVLGSGFDWIFMIKGCYSGVLCQRPGQTSDQP